MSSDTVRCPLGFRIKLLGEKQYMAYKEVVNKHLLKERKKNNGERREGGEKRRGKAEVKEERDREKQRCPAISGKSLS